MPKKETSDIDRAEKSLLAIAESIRNSDNKAGVLLTAVGIVFGFSLFSVEAFPKEDGVRRLFAIAFCALYLLSFVVSLLLLVIIVCPRRRNAQEKLRRKDYFLYAEDLYVHSKNGDLSSFLEKDCDKEAVLEQIRICSRISHQKETLLKMAAFSISVFVVSLVLLVVCLFV